MNYQHPLKRSNIEPPHRVPSHNLRSTPNFKASYISYIDHLVESNDTDHSQQDIAPSHKSFDLGSGLTSRSLANNGQKRPLSTKRDRPNEPTKAVPLEGQIGAPNSYRKPVKANPLTKDTPKNFNYKVPVIAAGNQQGALVSSRNKHFFVPLKDISNKVQEVRNPTSGRDREIEKEEIYKRKASEPEAGHVGNSEVISKYQKCIEAYEELAMRNKQAEESLRLEVLRGEEQRAYIEVLKKKIEENRNRFEYHIGAKKESRTVENGEKTERRNRTDDSLSLFCDLDAEVESLRANENMLNQHIETFRERLKETSLQKEVMGSKLGQSEQVILQVSNENRKLKDTVAGLQIEYMKAKEENGRLVEQVERMKGKVGEIEKVKKELGEARRNYEDLKLLSNEIDIQRKTGSKMLDEEVKARKVLEAEKEELLARLKAVEEEKVQMERVLGEERERGRSLKEKLEILEENYSTLRITLNENESELEKLRGAKQQDEESRQMLRRRVEELEREIEEMRERRQYESREKVVKTLREQVSLLEKENSLLKSSNESTRQLREENMVLQKKNEMMSKNFQELRGRWETLKGEYTKEVSRGNQLKGEIEKVERELDDIVETYLPQDEEEEKGAGSSRSTCSGTERLVERLKGKIEGLNERYKQAKVDLVKEMERCAEMEKEARECTVRKENAVLKEKLQRKTQELGEVERERNLFRVSNENLMQKFSQVTQQVLALKGEVNGMHNKENQGRNMMRESVVDGDIKVKEGVIHRLKAFVFNGEVKELVEEIMNIEIKIVRLGKAKEKVASWKNSARSVSTTDLMERKENSFLESQSTNKGEIEDVTEALEIEKSKKETLEKELSKLEAQERKRYDSLSTLEKQNFELKSEISRLMSELEINFSEYKDPKHEYYNRKVGNEKFEFSGGYDFALEALDTKGIKEGTISDFHMEYSMEKISDENGEGKDIEEIW